MMQVKNTESVYMDPTQLYDRPQGQKHLSFVVNFIYLYYKSWYTIMVTF